MIAVDTSIVVPAFASWHEDHGKALVAVREAWIPAHALVESYSVLTRLPAPHRAPAALVIEFCVFRPKRPVVPKEGGQGDGVGDRIPG